MGKIIYHYCNVESFKAIIQNKAIWLSSVYNLNDYKEIHWIKDKVLKKIKEYTNKNSYEKFNSFIKLFENQQPTVYIASFSQGDDLLSQWRAYANDGFGVAIGFNTDYFEQNDLIKTSEVLYDEKQQEVEIEKILEPLLNLDDKINFESKEFEEYCEIRKTINSGFRIAKCDETVGLFVSDTIGWRIAAKNRNIPFVYNYMFININTPFWEIIYSNYK